MDQVLKLHFFITIYLPLTLSLTLSTFPPTPCLCCYCYGSHASFAFAFGEAIYILIESTSNIMQHYVSKAGVKKTGKKNHGKKNLQVIGELTMVAPPRATDISVSNFGLTRLMITCRCQQCMEMVSLNRGHFTSCLPFMPIIRPIKRTTSLEHKCVIQGHLLKLLILLVSI